MLVQIKLRATVQFLSMELPSSEAFKVDL